MSRTQLTLLVEDLAALAAAAPGAGAATLERCLARGRPVTRTAPNADALRLALFGAEAGAAPPVGALTAVADGLAASDDGRYWLRVDPVTLTADLTRVFITAHGLADVPEDARAALRACVAETLGEHGHRLQHGHPDRWLLALEREPPVGFMRLPDALGLDMADALPGGADGREWRRLLTDIQVALHNTDVNRQRRQQGLREVNGAWFWGGGRLPRKTASPAFDCVAGDHPVTCGLAALAGCATRPGTAEGLTDALTGGGAVLCDWRVGRTGAGHELERLDGLLDSLSQQVARGSLELTLLDGGGSGWRLDRSALRRFWRRPRPLHERFVTGPGAPE